MDNAQRQELAALTQAVACGAEKTAGFDVGLSESLERLREFLARLDRPEPDGEEEDTLRIRVNEHIRMLTDVCKTVTTHVTQLRDVRDEFADLVKRFEDDSKTVHGSLRAHRQEVNTLSGRVGEVEKWCGQLDQRRNEAHTLLANQLAELTERVDKHIESTNNSLRQQRWDIDESSSCLDAPTPLPRAVCEHPETEQTYIGDGSRGRILMCLACRSLLYNGQCYIPAPKPAGSGVDRESADA